MADHLGSTANRKWLGRHDAAWDNAVSNEEKPNGKVPRASGPASGPSGANFAACMTMWRRSLCPDDFLDLLRRIDDAEDARPGKKVS